MSDIVRINGRTYTRSRAIAMGLIKRTEDPLSVEAKIAKGQLVRTEPVKSTATESVATAKPRRGRPAGSVNKPRITTPIVDKTDVNVIPAPKRIAPLVPQNIDHSGTPITDDATLAEIAARVVEFEMKQATDATPAT